MNLARDRFTAAAAALLLQALFIAVLVYSLAPIPAAKKLEREMILVLPRLIENLKQTPVPSTDRPQETSPALATPPPIAPPLPERPAVEEIPRFGNAPINCAPENYANLAAEDRAKCPRPGEGMTIEKAPGLMGIPSDAKDEAHWQEEFRREHAPLILFGEGDAPRVSGIDTLNQDMRTAPPCPPAKVGMCLHNAIIMSIKIK